MTGKKISLKWLLWLSALMLSACMGVPDKVKVVDSVDAKGNAVTLSHGPVASLKWPAMTMEFKLANAALIKDLRPGAKVAIEFVERQPGEWVITSVKK